MDQLRIELLKMEQKWSKEDEEYLGPFETQPIYVDCFKLDGSYGGIGHGKIWFTPEFGVMFTQEDYVEMMCLGEEDGDKLGSSGEGKANMDKSPS